MKESNSFLSLSIRQVVRRYQVPSLQQEKTQMAKIAFGKNFLMTQPKNTP